MRSMKQAGIILVIGLALTSTTMAQEESSPSPRILPNFTLRTSFVNTFQRGNVDDFFHSISQDPSRDVTAGSSAYFDLSYTFPLFSKSAGMGIGLMLFNSHAMWGTKLVFGGRAEIALQPFFMYVSLPIRFKMGSSSEIYIGTDPAILIGIISGSLSLLNGTHYDIAPAEALGFQVPVGIDYYFSDRFGVEFRGGFRFARGRVGWSNPDSPTGYTQFTVNDDLVYADFSGVFMTTGVLIRF